MLNMGTARADTHRLTWHQVDEGAYYTRRKTGVPVKRCDLYGLSEGDARAPLANSVPGWSARSTATTKCSRMTAQTWSSPKTSWTWRALKHRLSYFF
jgi:hypothetical protein